MCKACKMDPTEVKKQYIKQGMIEPEDFYDETDYTPRKKKKGCKRSKDGSACNFTKSKTEIWHHDREGYWHYWVTPVCERCNKKNWKEAKGYKSLTDPTQ